MEWAKFYTTFHDHRKVIELDANAIALWVLCFSWSGAQDTDGRIPRRIALRFMGGELGDEAAQRLVRVGMWEEVEGGYQMHNWHERQPSWEQREAAKANGRERQRKFRERRNQRTPVRNVVTNDEVTREEEKRVDTESESIPPLPPPSDETVTDARTQGDQEPSPAGVNGHLNGASSTPRLEPHWLPPLPGEPDEADDWAAVFGVAYRRTHRDNPPPPSVIGEMVSQARLCQDGGTPAEDIRRTLELCAEGNVTKAWGFDKVLVRVQGGNDAAAKPPPAPPPSFELMRMQATQQAIRERGAREAAARAAAGVTVINANARRSEHG
jgi:hypothetical protein